MNWQRSPPFLINIFGSKIRYVYEVGKKKTDEKYISIKMTLQKFSQIHQNN